MIYLLICLLIYLLMCFLICLLDRILTQCRESVREAL